MTEWEVFSKTELITFRHKNSVQFFETIQSFASLLLLDISKTTKNGQESYESTTSSWGAIQLVTSIDPRGDSDTENM